jgi:P-type Cu+ transporter
MWQVLFHCENPLVNFLPFLFLSTAIPLAAGVLYPFMKVGIPPTVAGAAMAMSSVSVILSSLQLKMYKPPKIAQK